MSNSNEIERIDIRFGSLNPPEPPSEKFRPEMVKHYFTEEDLDRYDQLRRQGYQQDLPDAIMVDKYRIYLNKINLKALEPLIVECCEEYLYPTVLTWADLYQVKDDLKTGVPEFRFLTLDQMLYWELDELERNLKALRYPDMDILILLNEARKLRGLEPVETTNKTTQHSENNPVNNQGPPEVKVNERQYTIIYESLKSEIRNELQEEMAREKHNEIKQSIKDTKLVFLIMTEKHNDQEEGYVWLGGRCDEGFLKLLRTVTQEETFYIQITPFDSSLPFKFTHAGVYGYNPYFLESDRSVTLPDYICGFLHTKYRGYHDFYLDLQPDAVNEFSLDYVPLDKKWEPRRKEYNLYDL